MHESALVRGLVRKVGALAAAEQARRVTAVHVWLGALSHLSAAHLRDHFERAAGGTVAEGAALEIEESDDPADPGAEHVRLTGIEVET